MASIASFKDTDFEAEVNALFEKRSCNFGKDAIPIQVVKEAVLKSVCGWHNGGTAENIINELGLVISGTCRQDELTTKGQAFMWWAFKGKYA
jgi:hypothetical protein